MPQWGLSEIGRSRTRAICKAASLGRSKSIISSGETKAIETAEIIANGLKLEVIVRRRTHENDRSSTGYLHGLEFENAANEFFAHPTLSFRGWERAIDAQARIVKEAELVFASWKDGDILMVGHGGVGTLLYCHFAGLPIQRLRDQPAGGGNYWAIDLQERKILHSWQAMEKL